MRWENYPIFRHPSDVVQGCNDGPFKNLDHNSSMALARLNIGDGIKKMEKKHRPVSMDKLNLSGLLGFDDLVLVHLFTVWDPWNVSSFFKTFLFPYISIATICYLNFDKAAARAFHQGSVRHTRGLSSWPALDNALWRFCLEPDVPW